MTSVEQQARDLLQPVMTRIWSYSVFSPERDAAEATTALAPLLAELSRLRTQETRIRAVGESLEQLARKYEKNHLANHGRGVLHAQHELLAALDSEESS